MAAGIGAARGAWGIFKQTKPQAKSCPWSLSMRAQQRKHSALCSLIYQFRRNKTLFPYRCLTRSTLQQAAALSRTASALSRAPSPVPVPAAHLLPDTFGKTKNPLRDFVSKQKGLCYCSSVFSPITLSRDISNKNSN